MGDIADMMVNGTMCQHCGVMNDDLIAHLKEHSPKNDPNKVYNLGESDVPPWQAPGVPWTCNDCKNNGKE